jgi:diguanylate cyclase (GGDEF)-like protein
MAVPVRSRLVPGVPRALLVVVTVLTAVQVAVALTPASDSVGLALGTALAVQAALAALLLWRARLETGERSLWKRLAVAAVLLGGGAALAAVLTGVRADHHVTLVPLVLAHLAAFPLVYGGMVLWNRDSSNVADPSDTLLGAAAVLAVVAVTDTVLGHVGSSLADQPWWHLQPVLMQTAAGLVLVGTAATVPYISGMARDPRARWLLAAVTADLVAGIGVVAGHRQAWAVAAAGVICTVLAAVLQPAPVPRTRTDPSATTIGAFVVIIASTIVLVVVAVSTPSETAAWCAGVAATASGVRLLLNVRDLSQLTVSRREALTDELTGLANRRAVLRRVAELCDEHEPVVVALLDLDKFKEVNDGLGHSAGDDLLRLVAARLQPVLAPADVLGRLGGDEFAVVARVPDTTAPAELALTLGRALHQQFAEPFEVGGLSLHVSVSVGLTHADGAAAGAGDGQAMRALLLRQADAAMYDAKRSGAEVTVYDGDRHVDSSGHLALVEEMRHGLAAGEFVLHHQPQVDIATGRTLGVEALVRWAHPTRGLLAPADFLLQAEVHGLMGQLTDTVLRLAVAQAATWRAAGLDLRVSVNLSASNLLDTALPRRVAELLESCAVPPSAIVLEVTESVLLSDPERSLATVAALAALGTTVSIDDFGTGYASLTYLRELPVAELKLDRSFTADLLTDARVAAIIASTIGLAHQLGLRVVAEGVEDRATLRDLRQLGCDESQGYLHSRPLPAAELEVWLRAQRVDALPALLG